MFKRLDQIKIFAWAGLLTLLLSHSEAQATSNKTPQQLRKTETELSEKENLATQLSRSLSSSRSEVTQLQQQLQAAAEQEQEQQRQTDALAQEMADLASKTAAARRALLETGQRGGGALAMMIRLSQLPPSLWWFYDGISLDQERRMLLLRGASRDLSDRAETLRRNLAAADALAAAYDDKKQQLAKAQADLEQRATELNAMISERQERARTQEGEHKALRQEMTKLASAARDMRGLLDRVAPTAIEKLPAPKNSLPKPPPAAAALLPVAGIVAENFGTKDADGIISRGISITSQAGARIIAPFAGKAVFAGPFKGFGTIVILQHEGGLHSLLAGFGKVDLVLGQKVASGEPIGTVAEGKGKAAPEIYYELRKDGEPINPLGSRKPA
jgi:murein hydrolase activator